MNAPFNALVDFIIFNRFEFANFEGIYFLLFLLISVSSFYIFRRSKYVLLPICIIFYACFSVKMTIFIAQLGLLNYLVGIILYWWKKKFLLVGIIIVDIACLGYYKYANFAIENTPAFLHPGVVSPITYLVIPLGISFFTFELIHYISDVYKGKKPLYNPVDFYTFLFFFPTLIAGPIKRFEKFIPQLNKRTFDTELMHEGVLLIIKGLFKKIVLADTLASFATYGFNEMQGPVAIIIGVYAFSLQIYFDFSGYTDIARGSAALFGIHIPENFRLPYLATSIRDFWRRWHITLMSWLRDYVYLPLGGSKRGKAITTRNTLIVFVLSGLWHGAGWHFIVWGIYHGFLVILSRMITLPAWISSIDRRTNLAVSRITTFQLVSLGWILFRAPTMTDATKIITKIFTAPHSSAPAGFWYMLTYVAILLVLYGASQILLKNITHVRFHKQVRYAIYSFGLLVTFLSIANIPNQFIYFQF